MSKTPSHKAYLVEDGKNEGDKGFWTQVGAAWKHKDGKGMDLIIPAGLAVTGRVVIREADRPEKTAEGAKPTTPRR